MQCAAKFYQTYNFMTALLGLRGNVRSVYAIIYGYTRDGLGFTGTREYLANTASCSVITVARALARLTRDGHITKITTDRNRYLANFEELRAFIDDGVLRKVGKYLDSASLPINAIPKHIETLSASDCYRISSKMIANTKKIKNINTPSSSTPRGEKGVSFPDFEGDPRHAPWGEYHIAWLGPSKSVIMTVEQLATLNSILGEALVKKYVERLEMQILTKGYEPHSAYATILRWAQEDFGPPGVHI